MFSRKNHSRRFKQSCASVGAEILEERRMPTATPVGQWLEVFTCPDDTDAAHRTGGDTGGGGIFNNGGTLDIGTSPNAGGPHVRVFSADGIIG